MVLVIITIIACPAGTSRTAFVKIDDAVLPEGRSTLRIIIHQPVNDFLRRITIEHKLMGIFLVRFIVISLRVDSSRSRDYIADKHRPKRSGPGNRIATGGSRTSDFTRNRINRNDRESMLSFGKVKSK